MSTRQLRFIIISSALVLVAVVAYTFSDARPPVSLTVLSYTTNKWPDQLADQLRSRTYVCALVAVTNNSTQPFTYSARGPKGSADYEILRETSEGWKAPDYFRCGTGLKDYTLPPGQGFTFEAVVESDKRCKVEFMYYDGRQPSRIWQQLPSWLKDRLPWPSGHAATTAPIDLREPRN